MKEQQAVLDFFAKMDNLSLGLAVAELMDTRREQLNTQFWRDLHDELDVLVAPQNLLWKVNATEDRNAPDNLVGLHCSPADIAPQYLYPMLEQQSLGAGLRIYFGLMWHTTPTPEQLALPAIVALQTALEARGFKQNERFLAWQWTNFHPRRRDFLLRYHREPQHVLTEVTRLFSTRLWDVRSDIEAANAALANVPRSNVVSLSGLRGKI